jgi:5,10-methenyltetrahydrofolate synthetase
VTDAPLADWPAIAAWRRDARAKLIAAREAVPLPARRARDAGVNALLERALEGVALGVVAFCWPYRGEVDVRFAIRTLRGRGIEAALPEVAGKGQPLRFRRWWPGVAMVPGALGIPAPAGTDLVVPDAALVPLVGFDGAGYRLGYGGGFFDRTLAALAVKPLAIGVGSDAARLATIHPQPHDVPMDFIVTETGMRAVEAGALVAVSPAEAAARAGALLAGRRR